MYYFPSFSLQRVPASDLRGNGRQKRSQAMTEAEVVSGAVAASWTIGAEEDGRVLYPACVMNE